MNDLNLVGFVKTVQNSWIKTIMETFVQAQMKHKDDYSLGYTSLSELCKHLIVCVLRDYNLDNLLEAYYNSKSISMTTFTILLVKHYTYLKLNHDKLIDNNTDLWLGPNSTFYSFSAIIIYYCYSILYKTSYFNIKFIPSACIIYNERKEILAVSRFTITFLLDALFYKKYHYIRIMLVITVFVTFNGWKRSYRRFALF
ncbi:MAG: hypothetical protein EXX96DRAFT_607891 [Benjaminiella poitrasii]|nr:MAG: hypothetical protein EXX96DRAFT_607891 [Benjaminiella poitrasii]